jgi:hypothetical protein
MQTDPDTYTDLTDPSRFADDPAVDVQERSQAVEEEVLERYEAVEGLAVIAVTDDDDRLLLERPEEAPVWLLPHSTVTAVQTFDDVAVTAMRLHTGLNVTLDGVFRVRTVDVHLEGDPSRETRTHEVVFGASLADPDQRVDEDALGEHGIDEVEWFAEPPADLPDGDGAADVETLLG